MNKEIRIRCRKQSKMSTVHNVRKTERKKEKKRRRESEIYKESRVIRNKYCMCKTRGRGRQVGKRRKQIKNFGRREE
jgi:hypothetical protein